MGDLRLSDADQFEAMVAGTFFDLPRKHGQDPWNGDFRRFITVDRQQLIDYLRLHPDKAEAYFERFEAVGAGDGAMMTKGGTGHDVPIVRKEGSTYAVAWLDHGKMRDVTKFRDIAEAVAEHVLVSHGKF